MKFFSLLLLLSLSGCGYRWQPDYPNAVRPTVTVPFVNGDEEGYLSAEIIKALSYSGLVDVVHRGGDYRLEIAIKGQTNEMIGYRTFPQKVDGKVRRTLRACEGRKGMSAEATLYKGCTQEIAYGPFMVAADADYDYVDGDSAQDLTFVNSAGTRVTVLPFSLGQLEPIDSAQQAVRTPLYTRLAQKIVDAISSAW